jgi:hypothetical protein
LSRYAALARGITVAVVMDDPCRVSEIHISPTPSTMRVSVTVARLAHNQKGTAQFRDPQPGDNLVSTYWREKKVASSGSHSATIKNDKP